MRSALSLMVLASLFTARATRAADGDECKLNPPAPELVHEIDQTPSYFAKTSADGRYMFFIGNDGNYILDLEHDGTMAKVPGPYDPVPAPPVPGQTETRFFTMPKPNMQFFDFNEVKAKMKQGQKVDLTGSSIFSPGVRPVYSDPDSTSSYQSVGVIGQNSSGRPIYRVANGNLNLNDYQSGDSSSDWKKVGRSSQRCSPAAGGAVQLPMLSKDGSMASGYDPATGTTKLFSINGDGSCKEAADLGFPTGKVEFNYQNNKITFHVDSYSSMRDGRQFSGVDSNMTKNVYTMDIKHSGSEITLGNVQRITANTKPGEGSYYPSFTASGKVVYVQGNRNPATNRVSYSFNRVDPGRGAPAPAMNIFTGDCPVVTAYYFALGDLMRKVCKNMAGNGLSSTDAALWALSLDPKACQQLVKKHWGEFSSQIKSNEQLLRSNRFQQQHLSDVTEEALSQVCPAENPASSAANWHPDIHSTFLGSGALETDPHQIFDHRCLSCHDGGRASKFDWDHLSLNQVNRMLIALQEGSMPQGNFENRAAMVQPLAQRLLEIQSQMEEGVANVVDQ